MMSRFSFNLQVPNCSSCKLTFSVGMIISPFS